MTMKKIIALMLALVCVFALASCGGTPDEIPDAPDYSNLEPFKTAVTASAPKTAVVEVSMETTISDEPMEGTFNISYGAENILVEYTYDQFREIDASNPTGEDKVAVTGTATIDKDGNVTDGAVSSTVTAAALAQYNLDGAKMTYTVQIGVLSATIQAANTESVLGVKIDADVTFTLTVANGKIASVTLNYNTPEGPAIISTTYSY